MTEPSDLVITYVVGVSGVLEESYKPVQEALNKNYRVVDVLPTPTQIGSAGSNHGSVIITVVLTKQGLGAPLYKK